MVVSLYSHPRWIAVAAAVRRRDNGRCTVARLLGGDCSGGTPHVHHIRPVADGGALFDMDNLASVCPGHHPVWEALRRSLLRAQDRTVDPPRPLCRHRHPTREAREACERRLARSRERLVAA